MLSATAPADLTVLFDLDAASSDDGSMAHTPPRESLSPPPWDGPHLPGLDRAAADLLLDADIAALLASPLPDFLAAPLLPAEDFAADAHYAFAARFLELQQDLPAGIAALTPESMGSPAEGYYSPGLSAAAGPEPDDHALPSPVHTDEADRRADRFSPAPWDQGYVSTTDILGKRPREADAAYDDAAYDNAEVRPAPKRRHASPAAPAPVEDAGTPPSAKDTASDAEDGQDGEHEDEDGAGNRRFACTHPGCGLRFRRKFNRNQHLLTHTSSKPFVCGKRCPTTGEVCTEAFRRGFDVRRHQASVHNHRKGEVKTRCLCGQQRRRK